MSTYEHSLLTARFAALAPRPLPGDWDDVLDRAGAVRPRRRLLARPLWRGGPRRKLGVVLAAVALVAAVATTAYGTVRVLILDRGFIGLPPLGATPSTPKIGELVLRWSGRSATHARADGSAPLVQVWVYADGRVIWSEESSQSSRAIPEGANKLVSGYLEQRLTPEGVELLRSEVAELFDRSRSLLETVPDDPPGPGYDPPRGSVLFVPPDYGSPWGSVEVSDGDRLIRLRWEHACPPPTVAPRCVEASSGVTATRDQFSALRRVDALLTDPASVLPASAWAVRKVRAYVASHYEACMHTSPPKDVSQLLSLLPTQAASVLRGKSLTGSEDDMVEAREGGHVVVVGRSATYCAKLTTGEASEVAEALSELDPRPGQGARLAYQLTGRPHGDVGTEIWFEPYFPHGQVTCSACG